MQKIEKKQLEDLLSKVKFTTKRKNRIGRENLAYSGIDTIKISVILILFVIIPFGWMYIDGVFLDFELDEVLKYLISYSIFLFNSFVSLFFIYFVGLASIYMLSRMKKTFIIIYFFEDFIIKKIEYKNNIKLTKIKYDEFEGFEIIYRGHKDNNQKTLTAYVKDRSKKVNDIYCIFDNYDIENFRNFYEQNNYLSKNISEKVSI